MADANMKELSAHIIQQKISKFFHAGLLAKMKPLIQGRAHVWLVGVYTGKT